jgi:hypothetical protein
VACAADRERQVVLGLKRVLDAALDVTHYLGQTRSHQIGGHLTFFKSQKSRL